jgi:PAS domain S-box-containing protein
MGDTVVDAGLYRRGRFITTVARWLSLGFGLLSLAFMWDSPLTRRGAAVGVAAGYGAWMLVSHAWQKRRPGDRRPRIGHDLADAAAVGLGAAASGGMASPVWLLLYPHVVAVSMRAGLVYALAVGTLDAAIVFALTAISVQHPLGTLHALALVFCAFLGGLTSSHLKAVLAAHEAARREQEEALARLRESEARYRHLLERIQDGVVIVQDGRIVYANQVFGTMVGDTPAALAGMDFRELIPPEDRAEISDRYQRWEQSQAISGLMESRLRTRQGATLLVSLRAGSVEFQGRRSVITTIRDITRARSLEQDLKAHAERLAAINEIANAVNLSLTIEDIFAVVAQETRRLVPFDRLTIALVDDETNEVETVAVGRAVSRQTGAFTRDHVAWAFRQPRAWCEGDPEPAPPGHRHLIADDAVRAVAVVPLLSRDRAIGSLNLGRLRPVPFSALDLAVMEPVARHIAIALDNARLLADVRRRGHEMESLVEVGRRVVERLDVKDLLPLVARSVNRVMRTSHCVLLLRAGDSFRVAAQEGIEQEVVEAWKGLGLRDSLSGMVLEQGRPVASLDMQQEPRLFFPEMIRRFGYRSFLGVPLRRGSETLGTLEVLTKHVRRFGAEDQALMQAFADQAAVALENARLFEEARTHLASVIEANRQLEELDRMRRQYLRNVSHEFRTPLTVIKGYAEFLIDSPPAGAGAARDVMRVIVDSCDRVIDMVDTLIDVSRIEQENAGHALELSALDLKEVTAAAVESLRPAAERKGIALELDLGERLPCNGDRGLLQQAVRRLVDNAVKYSAPGGRVVLRAREEAASIALEVEDFGIGIAEEHVPRIFEKFYMVDGGMSRRSGGTGVGLYLVREIVRLHEGTVEVHSRPGQGTRFAVRLPRAGPVAAPA